MKALEKYLNEHLAGSHAAVNLLKTLMRENGSDFHTYEQLHDSVSKNQKALIALFRQAGFRRARGTEMAARAGSIFALMRFKSHGLQTGGLGRMEALEALHLGVQGQLLLWNNLLLPGAALSLWEKRDLAALRQSAETQLATVEALRVEAAQRALSRSGATPAQPASP